jgi:hypothetical protein
MNSSGGYLDAAQNTPIAAGHYGRVTYAKAVWLTAGDYITVVCNQDSGANLNVMAYYTNATWGPLAGVKGDTGPIGPQGPPGPTGPAGSTNNSFLRAFGPDTATMVPATTWTVLPLDPAGEAWRQFGDVCWEWVPPGDPDYALYGGGIRCLKEGIYDMVGAAVFDASNQTGDRACQVIEVKGPYANQWRLATSMPMPKVALGGVIVSGETYQYVGNIVQLQAWASVNTQTTSNPQSEWLSVTRIGSGPKGDIGATGPTGPAGPTGPKGDPGIGTDTVGCRAYHSTPQTATTNLAMVANFSTTRWDNDNMHLASSSKLTCNTAGAYDIGAWAAWAPSNVGFREIRIRLNGSLVIARVQMTGVVYDSGDTAQNVSCIYQLAVGDYVEFVVLADIGLSGTIALNTIEVWASRQTGMGPQGPPGATGGQGLPTGGATGQVLTKTSAVDYAANWQTPAGGGTGVDLLLMGG